MITRFIFTVLFLWGGLLFAQLGKLAEVSEILDRYQKTGNLTDLDWAKAMLDTIAVHPETKSDPIIWYYRGFVHKEIYKRKDAGNPQSVFRLNALDYFKMAIQLDTAKKQLVVCRGNIRFIASTFFNDAATNLNPDNYEYAIKYYEMYKTNMTFSEPMTNFKQRDVEFYLALASVYTKISEMDPLRKKIFFNKSRETYDKVLALDPDNLGANYNLGILYYNRAVDIISTSNYDVDLVSLNQIQDTCINLFRQSLPYMEHAYHLDPTNKYVLIGLSGIYFSLNERDKSDRYKKELELIEKEEIIPPK